MQMLLIFYSVSQYILMYQHSSLLFFMMLIYALSAFGFISVFCPMTARCRKLKAVMCIHD